MEEDLKILKAFRNYNKFYKEENGKLTITIDLDLKTDLDKALENLLTRYKQLEEENKKMEELIENAECDMSTNFIRKSKVKEKIEDLKQNNNGDDYNLTNVIMILQELLREE